MSSAAAGTGATRVSVVLPTYERRELVTEAVASVLAQSYDGGFELIVVDDGSDDGTGEALSAFGTRLRYVWQPNRGKSAARNAGIELARGSAVALLDSDDRWRPDHLRSAMGVLDRLGDALMVSTTPNHVIGGRAGPARGYLFDALPKQLFGNAVGYPSSWVVRREPLRAVGGFDEKMMVGEDSELLVRLALRGPFAALHRRTLEKRYTDGQQSWGRRSGASLTWFEYRTRRAIEQVESFPGPRGRELAVKANGAAEFARALRAIEQEQDDSVRTVLERACRMLPELSSEPELVAERMRLLPDWTEPRAHVRHLALAAKAWPDPGADTPQFLRWCAAAVAVRIGRPGQAAALVTQPPRATPGFARRIAPTMVRRVRRGLDAHLHRHRQSARE